MPIIKGTTNIGAIYKGTTPISAIYKGSTLVYSSFSWESYGYTYLYNSLIPTTINSKNVLDKAKISKIYANGVVENQLNSNGDFHTDSGYTIYEPNYESLSIANNTMTLELLNNISSGVAIRLNTLATFYQNHKYFFNAKIKSIVGTNKIGIGFENTSGQFVENTIAQGSMSNVSGIITSSVQQSHTIIRFNGAHSAGSKIEISEYEIIDLTLMFGTGNEPTTLTDNRIQKLLNRGYIDYNAGSYKGTDISEFSSEPYNLFDGELEQGAINATTGEPEVSSSGVRSANFIKVISNRNYTFELTNSGTTTPSNYIVCEYDKNHNYIKRTVSYSNNYNFSLTNETNYVKLLYYSSTGQSLDGIQICFHETGTRTGYAPHTQPQTSQLRYQGNGALSVHDTYEITATSHIFTKNMNIYTFNGSEIISSWRDDTNNYGYLMTLNDSFQNNAGSYSNQSDKPNLICSNFTTENYVGAFNSTVNNCISRVPNDATKRIVIRSSSITTTSDMLSYLTGKTLYYELATPQVITIPRKRLGVVDLGTLNWTYVSSQARFYSTSISNVIKKVADSNIGNIVSSLYTTTSYDIGISRTTNNIIWVDSAGNIGLRNATYTDANSLKTAMSGTYLFYETNEDVTDITNIINVEAGGTITSDSVVLPNVDTLIKCK